MLTTLLAPAMHLPVSFQHLILHLVALVIPTIAQDLILEHNGQGSLTSTGFPTECCSASSHTIRYEGVSSGHIRLVFTDLDLPPGSALHLYDGDSPLSPPFYYQPELYSRGDITALSWLREGIQSTGNAIHIKFVPSSQKVDSVYVGFRAVAWITNSLSWRYWDVSADCPLVREASLSGLLTFRISSGNSTLPFFYPTMQRGHLEVENVQYDCIWQLKPPQPEQGVYMLIRDLKVQYLDAEGDPENYEIEIIKGLSSQGFSLQKYSGRGKTKMDIASVHETGMFHSLDGLYIRAQVPSSIKDFLLVFVYGTFSPKQPLSDETVQGSEEEDGKQTVCPEGFLCRSSDWCIPERNICDGVAQCKDLSDEDYDMCLAYVPPYIGETETTTKKPVEVEHSCPFEEAQKLCPDGSCIRKESTCGDACDFNKRPCEDGTCVAYNGGRCVDEPCRDQTPFMCDGGYTCIYNQSKCNQECNCEDCTDNNFSLCGFVAYVSLDTQRMCLFIFVPFTIVFFILFSAYKKKGGNFSSHFGSKWRPGSERTDNVELASTTVATNLDRMGSVSPRPSPHHSRTHSGSSSHHGSGHGSGHRRHRHRSRHTSGEQTQNNDNGEAPRATSTLTLEVPSDSCSPPPAYEDVTTSDPKELLLPVEEDPPPPSYSSLPLNSNSRSENV